MLASKRVAGVTPEVNFRECLTFMPLASTNKAAHSALKPRGDVTRSPKQGYQWPHKKDLRPPIFFKKKWPSCVTSWWNQVAQERFWWPQATTPNESFRYFNYKTVLNGQRNHHFSFLEFFHSETHVCVCVWKFSTLLWKENTKGILLIWHWLTYIPPHSSYEYTYQFNPKTDCQICSRKREWQKIKLSNQKVNGGESS